MVNMIVHQRAFASPTALGGMMLLGEPEAGSAFIERDEDGLQPASSPVQPETARVGSLSQGYPLERAPKISQSRYLGQRIVLRCVDRLLILLPNCGHQGQGYLFADTVTRRLAAYRVQGDRASGRTRKVSALARCSL